MSLDTETLSIPGSSDLVSKVADRLRYFPESQRPDLGPSHSPDRADALVHAVTDLILNRNPINFW